MPHHIVRITASAITLMLAAGGSSADLLHVPGQYPTVQAAIDAADDGDEIVIAVGTYREHTNVLGKAITIRSSDPDNSEIVASTVLSGDLNEDGVPDGIVIRCTSGETPDSILDGLTVRDGLGVGTGAGIHIDNSALTIRRCVFTSFDGSAVLAKLQGQTLTIEDSQFVDTTVPGTPGAPAVNLYDTTRDSTFLASGCSFLRCTNGGEISVAGGIESRIAYTTILDSSFTECSGKGGAVSFSYYEATVKEALVERCTFKRNTAWVGGAINIVYGGVLTVVDSSFEENFAEVVAGAINSWQAPVFVRGCEFVRNGYNPETGAVTERGGAMDIASGTYGNLVVEDSIFRSNIASHEGGAIAFGNKAAIITNSTFVGNSAPNGAPIAIVSGSGRDPSDIKMLGCSVVGNRTAGPTISGKRFTLYHCAFAQNSSDIGLLLDAQITRIIAGCLFLEEPLVPPQFEIHRSIVPGGWVGIGNIDADPMIVRLPSDGGDGWGDDFTTLGIDESANDDAGDFTPMPGSPMIDAGDSSLNPLDTRDWDLDGDSSELIEYPTDINGSPRTVDHLLTPDADGVAIPAIDIGPVEFQPIPCPADTNNDGSLTPADFTAWIAAFNAMAPQCDQNGDGSCTPADFTAWIANFNAGC